jgi:hypothetical protein
MGGARLGCCCNRGVASAASGFSTASVGSAASVISKAMSLERTLSTSRKLGESAKTFIARQVEFQNNQGHCLPWLISSKSNTRYNASFLLRSLLFLLHVERKCHSRSCEPPHLPVEALSIASSCINVPKNVSLGAPHVTRKGGLAQGELTESNRGYFPRISQYKVYEE